ncbi:putative Carnosine N-methyltransferase [Blattamonas nauphoetae]|uniref:carnosine N-methyltransferase n=1 Tax=Blattamonas nauphoetae TaxID=2049346 RepID=A0ABQ9Y5X4_9EUKA|nr:putative Carnosine N-methyltransferase [Blattamonas nauphoetae]
MDIVPSETLSPPQCDDDACSCDSSEIDEQNHFFDVIQAFSTYIACSMKRVIKYEQDSRKMSSFGKTHFEQIFIDRIASLKQKIAINQEFLSFIIQPQLQTMDQSQFELASEWNASKVRSTLSQFMREWSSEGQDERNQYTPLFLSTLERYLPISETRQPSVLIPGCGLGRLCFDVAQRGYRVEGNEFSYFMLLGSSAVLNRLLVADNHKKDQPNITEGTDEQDTDDESTWTIYPFVSQFNNNTSFENQVRPVVIPDTHIDSFPPDWAMSMSAGEFCQVYDEQPSSFDCVIFHFFIDTAHDIAEYITTVSTTLKPGGIFMIYGPLLYHYGDMETEYSVDYTFDDVKHLLRTSHFELLDESVHQCTYCADPRSLMKTVYSAHFILAKKKI